MHGYIYTKRKWLLLITVLHYSFSFAQTADFSFTATDGNYCTPYKITFTQACTGNPNGFLWDFGNGEKGLNPSEGMVYTIPGTYSITLTALYPTKAISSTKTITVNPSPDISLTANKTNLCTPGNVNFIIAGSGSISNYQWDFGDGTALQNGASSAAAHNYNDYGNFTAIVTASTALGCKATAALTINVSKFGIIGSMSTDTGCIPSATALNISTSLPAGDNPLNYTWNFGDGTAPVTGPDSFANHLYNTTDSIFNANVTIKTIGGCINIFKFDPFAFGTPPVNTIARTILQRDTFCGSEKIQFHGRALNANLYKWDFGDSTEASIADTLVTHQYRSLGSKKVMVTPYFNGCEGTKDSIIVFIKGVIANAGYSNACSRKNAYQFTNASLGNISHFSWEFGDAPGIKDSLHLSTTHNFPIAGSFTAALSLADNISGCTDTATYPIYTAVPLFSSSSNQVCKDSLIMYQVSNSYPEIAGYSYEFHINGDTIMNGPDAVLKYYPSKHGSFANFVVIKDALDGTCDDTLQLTSNTIVRGPVVNFTSTQRACYNQRFVFTDNSHPFYPAEVITGWRWEFGDSSESATKNPSPHLFPQLAAQYDMTYTVTDVNGCSQKMQKHLWVDRLPQVMSFPAMDTICRGRDTAILTGYTTDSLVWLPATSISCTSCDTTAVFPLVTTAYIAQATNRFGCRSYDTSIVKVFAPFQLKVSPADTSICPGSSVAYSLDVKGITTWSSTTMRNPVGQNHVATPSADITYLVSVQDSAGCFSDTASARVHVLPLPSVNAGPDKVVPYNSTFTIAPVYSADVSSYLWEPAANLPCNNCASITGTALQTTTYTIKTTSVNGCKSSDNITFFIACENGNLLMPTAFSPNGNGVNDYFYPIARGYKTIKKFMIFNRQGFKVFERQDFAPNIRSLGWDGRIKGIEPSDSQSFAWFIEAECEQGEIITSKGMVVLVH